MKLKYLTNSSFFDLNEIYLCYGLLLSDSGYSFLVKDKIDKFRLWDSKDFEIIEFGYPINKWFFYQNQIIKTNYIDWSDDYIVEKFLFFGDNYFVNNPKDLLAVYTWEKNDFYID